MKRWFRSSMKVLQAVVTLGVFVLILFGQQPRTTAAQSRPSRLDTSDIRVLLLRFEAGSRSNWHRHSGWQILMAEEGRGRTQVRGEAVQELLPGRPIYVGPGVVHWHGAAPDEHFLQLTFYSGDVTGLEPVSEEDYLGR